MRILLLGGSGQLGVEIRGKALDLNFEVISPVSSELDVSDEKAVRFLAREVSPDLIINSAAYTAVDKAETEKDLAYLINREGAKNAALACKDLGARLIHVSTDYVFDGHHCSPILESETPCPINVYGASKLAGEEEIRKVLSNEALIIRTSWLHGRHGVNFVKTMVELFKTKEVVRVVDDQIGNPTWTGWLAEVILDLGRIKASGTLHGACSGATSWFGFAQEILNNVRGKLEGASLVQLEPQSTEELKRPANRPRYSVLDCTRLSNLLGRQPITWQEGLKGHLIELGL